MLLGETTQGRARKRELCDQPCIHMITCAPVAMAALQDQTWWHHLVGLSGWEGGEREGGEREGKERGEEG